MRIISSSCSRSYLLRVIPVCHFSLSPPRSASEVPRDPFADPTVQSFYEKIRNHQGAVDAMMDMRKIMEEKGYDVTKPPSTMQMMKMGLDGDLRKGVQKLLEEFKRASIELNPETVKDLFSKFKPPN